MNIAYIRVSTKEQHEDRQIEALDRALGKGEYKAFIEKISGKNMDRPELKKMLEYVREGDIIYVSELSRLGRSTADLWAIIKEIEKKGASFKSLKESFDTSTPAGKLQLTMLVAVAEFERDIIRERQAEGIAIAKAKGVYKGRKKCTLKDIEEVRKKRNMGVPVAVLARENHVSRTTMYRLLNDARGAQRLTE
ncbi:MAG: recombinase family protein [Lachnospiraceae bacterium]|nr:recombinase family protein [Lachnospiraceae bacterium]